MKLKRNKKYSYKPRYYKGDGNPYELKHKFDGYRKTVNTPKGIKAKFNAALDEYQNDRDDSVNKRVFIIAGVLILLFLFLIGFDLSIFFPKG
ncbi:riboflavin synthase subunit beta [Winogradskyella flava]